MMNPLSSPHYPRKHKHRLHKEQNALHLYVIIAYQGILHSETCWWFPRNCSFFLYFFKSYCQSTSCNSWVSRLIYKIMPDKWINKDDQSRYVKLSNMIFYTLVLSKFKLLWQLVLTACPALFSIVALSFLRRLVCNECILKTNNSLVY